ncbi:MAG: hypothetical protein ACFCVA_03850, partial [Gammaproteobacteria bacterium]
WRLASGLRAGMTGVFIWAGLGGLASRTLSPWLRSYQNSYRAGTQSRSGSPPIGSSRESQGAVIPARIAGMQHREVAQTAIHGDWVPAIPAGTTGLKERIGGKRDRVTG